MPSYSPLGLLVMGVCSLGITVGRAKPQPSALFGDHAVLQSGAHVPVWGTADPAESITVVYAQASAHTVADGKGAWRVNLENLQAGTSGELRITGNGQHISQDVIVGDVWLCSGQSNMEWPLRKTENAQAEIASANIPLIRQFLVEAQRGESIRGQWRVCSPANAGVFTAVGYFFAREIFAKHHLPIGLINASEGGTPIEAWLDASAINENPEFHLVNERWQETLAAYPEKKAIYDDALAAWKSKRDAAQKQGVAFKEKEPSRPVGAGHKNEPSLRFNWLIRPLVPVALRGILWYQGEQNTSRHDEYAALFKALIADWRKQWNDDHLPFLYVQLPNITEASGKREWPGLRQAQASLEAPPLNLMAVTIDVGDPRDVHPRNKQPVGHRLALLAERYVYGDSSVSATGPRLTSATEHDGRVTLVLSTDNPSSKIDWRPSGQAAGSFELAGQDGKFWPAKATFAADPDHISVQTDNVDRPVAVRYLWQSNPSPVIFDSGGLPAPPFSTLVEAR